MPTYEKFSVETQKKLYEELTSSIAGNDDMWNLKGRFEEIDVKYLRETLNWKRSADGKRQCKKDNLTGNEIQDIEPPVVLKDADSALGFFVELFLSNPAVFTPISAPGSQEITEKIEALMLEWASFYGWKAAIIKWLKDLIKYNYGVIEVAWEEVEDNGLNIDLISNERIIEKKWYKGVNLAYKSIYNCIWDTSVEASRVSSEGTYIGYKELWSYQKLKDNYTRMQKERAVHGNLDEYAKNTTNLDALFVYNIPNINASVFTELQDFSWSHWFENDAMYKNIDSKYQVLQLYLRMIPGDFGIKTIAKGTSAIYHLTFVNGKLFTAEKLQNAHNLFPLVLSTLNEGAVGYQEKSFAENVIPFQEVSRGLMAAKMEATRRSLVDRAIYNPRLLDQRQVNNPSSPAKMPIRNSAYMSDLRNAYYQIPFDGRDAQTYLQDLGVVDNMSNQVNGFNPAMQGQFVKGNKSPGEFAAIMQRAGARPQISAHFLDSTGWSQIKHMMRLNILQYAGPIEVMNPQTGVKSNITVEELAQNDFTFKLTDGLNPINNTANTDFLMAMIQILPQISQMQGVPLTYDLVGMITYIMQLKTSIKLEDFKLQAPVPQQQPGANNAPTQPNPAG